MVSLGLEKLRLPRLGQHGLRHSIDRSKPGTVSGTSDSHRRLFRAHIEGEKCLKLETMQVEPGGSHTLAAEFVLDVVEQIIAVDNHVGLVHRKHG